MSRLIAIRVGVWSSTIRMRSLGFALSAEGSAGVCMGEYDIGYVQRAPVGCSNGPRAASTSLPSAGYSTVIPQELQATGAPNPPARPPRAVGVEQFVRAVPNLILHRHAAVDPIAQIIKWD